MILTNFFASSHQSQRVNYYTGVLKKRKKNPFVIFKCTRKRGRNSITMRFYPHDESITKDSPLTGMEIKGRKSTTPHSSNLPNHRVKIANGGGGWLFYELSSPRDIRKFRKRDFSFFFFSFFFFFLPRSSTRPRKQKPAKILPITSL